MSKHVEAVFKGVYVSRTELSHLHEAGIASKLTYGCVLPGAFEHLWKA